MPVEIKNIAILGLGLIGGSIAKVIKQSGGKYFIGAFDKQHVIDAALNDKMIDSQINDIAGLNKYELIFLCLPINESIEMFDIITKNLKKGQILTDVCSVKLPFEKKWNKLKSEGTYIGGHPMTGKEIGGYENSDPLLFENSIYILTRTIKDDLQLAEFRKVIELLGANVLTIHAKQHDVIAASVSHLPQILSIALVNTAALKTDEYNFLDLAAGGFRDMTRIAASDFNIWESIIKENKREIIIALDKLGMELNDLKKIIENDDFEKLNQKFESARKSRDEIPQNTKGFLNPLYDLFVFVEDKPGAVSKISTALFDYNINIKDIELLKIREGRGGTFRLSFKNTDDAEKASGILKNLGFKIN